ncbi:hypothetical protein [Streptomyces sp. NPDC001601]|uniref:hypothetical protein n=1 Tax=Streptomyces sp. NPDC001601 TaxID=3364592 RepID=UPI00369DA553
MNLAAGAESTGHFRSPSPSSVKGRTGERPVLGDAPGVPVLRGLPRGLLGLLGGVRQDTFGGLSRSAQGGTFREHGFNGDFERVHRCGVLSVEVRAGQQTYADIGNTAAHLRGLLDGRRAGNR